MKRSLIRLALALSTLISSSVCAREFHVSVTGNDNYAGDDSQPLKTISAAAERAHPGDIVTVHVGTYRERIDPPRGGTSDKTRIIYQAARGEKVVITGSDRFQGWERIAGDSWKLVIPSARFGDFNPYAETVSGDWFSGQGRIHRRGNVYLNGEWLPEAPNLNAITNPNGDKPMWFSIVDGLVEIGTDFLMNVASIKIGGTSIDASKATARNGPRNAANSEGGQCVDFITSGAWLRYDAVNFGNGTETLTIRAAAIPSAGGAIEFRDGHFDGPLLGKCEIQPTGDWQKWQDFTATIRRTSGVKQLFLVFKNAVAAEAATGPTGNPHNTTIYARFPGIDPNESDVEIGVRPTVFTPEKTNIDYITLRGFELRNAATNWAAPTMGQVGLVTAYWCKGWIIENNEICYSRCGGITLGKYSDQWDGQRGTTEGYYLTIEDALKKDGWSKDKIGSHLVRNNHIHHCGQVGIVGSLGCAFSRIEGNDIHDCNMQGIWGGAEMAGIKFHGAIDTVITDNHIHHNGNAGGIWLDWMAQGAQIVNNLLHDNSGQDIFCEVDHGPYLIANNIMLSGSAHFANSQGGAYAHNLMTGSIRAVADRRKTPFMKPHSTETVGLHDCPVGDVRWVNNLLAGSSNLATYNDVSLPVTMTGNVFTKGATASKFDTKSLLMPDFDPAIRLNRKSDGWYLSLKSDLVWRSAAKRSLVTTATLGKAVIPNVPFENPDGGPLKIDTDYFGKKRDSAHPFPGPFETPANGEIKVWPRD